MHVIFLIRIIWLGLSVEILYLSLRRLSQLNSMHDVSELISVMSYGLILITFPTGIVSFILLVVIGFISSFVGLYIDNKFIAAIMIWLLFLAGGYFQWFFLINKIIKR